MKEKSSLLAVAAVCFLCCVLTGHATGYVRDVPVDPNIQPAPALTEELATLNAPNAAYLVYDAGDGSIIDAMENISAANVRVRSNSNPVTAQDWQWCDIVIIGANSGTDSLTGIDAQDIEFHIMGRVILSGHDADLHASDEYSGDTQWAAQKFLAQSINYVLSGAGKGLIGFGDSTAAFEWAPASWGLTCTKGLDEENVTSFTQEGLASGIYNGLTLGLMSNWEISFHVRFDDYAEGFSPFEVGYFNGQPGVVTIGAPINPMGFELMKYDDIPDANCVNINDPIKYTVTWNNTTEQTFYDVYVKDIFPVGVTYPVEYSLDPNTWEMISSDPFYQQDHTYVYPIGTLYPDDFGLLQLDVIVNSAAEPGYFLRNTAELWGTVYDANNLPVERLVATAYVDTLACCWDTDGILYVDRSATGSNTGVSWEHAYTSLDSALTRARETQCTFDYVIHVAQGKYAPTDLENGFVLSENVSVYGGFPIGGSDFADRNPKRYETILTGLIDEDEFPDATKVVTMGDGTLLDGVTVTGSLEYGAYGNGVDFSLSHSVVKENFGYGIYAENCNVDVSWTTIKSNVADGLYHLGEEYSIAVSNSWLLRNGEYGIRCVSSTPTILNSIISESDMVKRGREGIYIKNPKYRPQLFNLTVANNRAAGIYFEDDGDPNNPVYPDLQNSIVYFNKGEKQIKGFDPDLCANFCCIQDCNEPGTTNYNDDPEFAYRVDPNGAPDPNNYHLAYDAFCKDKGNPFLDYAAQVDIDGEGLDRKYGSYVDIGADEVYDCYDDYLSDADVHNDLDFDADGSVGLSEFALFSRAWLTYDPNHPYCDPNNPNYVSDPNATGYIDDEDKLRFNPICDLDEDLHVGLADLIAFCEDWLWIACWKLEEINAMMSGVEQLSQSLDAGLMETSQVISEPEATVEEQIFQLEDAIAFLEQIWLEEVDIQQEISLEDWQAFMDAIYLNLANCRLELSR